MRGLVLVYVSSRKLNIAQHEGWVRIGFGLSWVLVWWWWGVAWGINVSHACRIEWVRAGGPNPPSRIPSWQIGHGWGLGVGGRVQIAACFPIAMFLNPHHLFHGETLKNERVGTIHFPVPTRFPAKMAISRLFHCMVNLLFDIWWCCRSSIKSGPAPFERS